MPNGQLGLRSALLIFVGLLSAIVILPGITSIGRSQAQTSSQADTLAAWGKIATVLQHPRCLNCHQLDSPLQGNMRRPHIPHVVRGPDNHGVVAMRCGNCHNETGNNTTSRTPGAPGWSLAPVSMLWQGLSVGDLCRSVRDPAHNGNRPGQALIEHIGTDRLVGWGWDPGPGREPVPMPRTELVEYMKVWVAGGMACPQ